MQIDRQISLAPANAPGAPICPLKCSNCGGVCDAVLSLLSPDEKTAYLGWQLKLSGSRGASPGQA